MATYRITVLEFDGKEYTYLLGDSYKYWHQQFREFCSEYKPLELVSISKSVNTFPQDGTKWCLESGFQDLLTECNLRKPYYYWQFQEVSKATWKKAEDILKSFLPKPE